MGNEKKNDGKWAPWWIYVVLIVGCNLAKQKLLEGVPDIVNIAVTLVLVAVLFTLITAIYRGMYSSRQRQR